VTEGGTEGQSIRLLGPQTLAPGHWNVRTRPDCAKPASQQVRPLHEGATWAAQKGRWRKGGGGTKRNLRD